MKAYYYCSIFKKESLISYHESIIFGIFLAENQIELKSKILTSKKALTLIENGYDFSTFEYGLIPPEIAPINCPV